MIIVTTNSQRSADESICFRPAIRIARLAAVLFVPYVLFGGLLTFVFDGQCESYVVAAEGDEPKSAPPTESAPVADANAATPTLPAKLIPPDLIPYRVHLAVSFSNDGSIGRVVRERILTQLSHAVLRSVSGLWDQTVVENDWLSPANSEGVSRLTPEILKARFSREEWDKVFCIAIETDGSGFRLSGREWDATIESLGPVSELRVHEDRELGHSAFVLANSLFRADTHVIKADGQAAELVLRGGEFPPPDEDCGQLASGDYLKADLLVLDREKKVKGIQAVPWTFLRVDSVDRGNIQCSVQSGLRAALPGKRRRLETMAVEVKPHLAASRVHLKLSRNPLRSLVGYHITLTSVHPREIASWEKAQQEKSATDPATPAPGSIQYLLTDRRGNVSIPRSSEHPMIWLSVRSGKVLLARVPYVPGLEAGTDLELPDDTIRLKAEGEISLLQGRLIDTVAQGAVFRSRALALLKDGKTEEALEFKQRWDKLAKRDDFQKDLSTIRVTGVEAARREKDKLTETRVAKLCLDADELIKRYLDPAKSADFEAEFAEFKQLKTE
ncbi:MAG: hypothetical protein ACKVT0_16400 [Planctomycetaceae bacterium]